MGARIWLDLEHDGPGGLVQPEEADDLVSPHDGAGGFLLHLPQHGQFQGILVFAQAMAAGHGGITVGQVLPLVVHQAGHMAVQPARSQDLRHKIVELNEDREFPQGAAGGVQEPGLEAHHSLARGV